MKQTGDYLGRGWTFPLKTNLQGGIGLSEGKEDVKEAIQIILRTQLGERMYRPDFGCRLFELTFAPLNTRTLFLIRLYVQEALEIWEPRIDLGEIELDPDPILGMVNITINYYLKATHSPGSIVYPFYLMTSGQ
ncbi:MAG: GPW/gp25 family protein [Prochloraceae cyanobacterium]|nr:GPW/gp25 family protein [Prochloraceae cyanobacterium]